MRTSWLAIQDYARKIFTKLAQFSECRLNEGSTEMWSAGGWVYSFTDRSGVVSRACLESYLKAPNNCTFHQVI
jgi:hypothetical protein